jgi:hypothetical protein
MWYEDPEYYENFDGYLHHEKQTEILIHSDYPDISPINTSPQELKKKKESQYKKRLYKK